MNKKEFFFDFHGSVTLTEDDIWPEGDGPENPTVEDVKQLIGSRYEHIFEGGQDMAYFLRDWDLENVVVLSVSEAKPSKK